MIRKLTYFGGIVFGVVAVLGFLCGANLGIPSPWYQILTFASFFISVILFDIYKYGRLCKKRIR